MDNNSERTGRENRKQSRMYLVLLVVVLLCGLAVRFYDLTDPPLDFHPTRQLGSAIIARGMYYQNLLEAPDWQRETAVAMWKNHAYYEPRILEWVVAQTYHLVGGEYLWIARIYTSLIWVLGGVALFSLARYFADWNGAFTSVIVYLFLPFGVLASRSFQPDPIMVSLVIVSLLTFYRWHLRPNWARALLAGACAGVAILVKPVAVFPLLPAFVLLTAYKCGMKQVLSNLQHWMIILLAILPTAVYGLWLIPGRPGGFLQFETFQFLHLLVDPSFYTEWIQRIHSTVGFDLFMLAVIGSFLIIEERGRAMMFGVWIGYAVFAAILPYRIMTHDYYQLMLIPFVALGLSTIGTSVAKRIVDLKSFWKLMALGIIAGWIFVRVMQVKVELDQRDDRNEVERWSELRANLPRDSSIIALSHAYGFRLQYFAWINAENWPTIADMRLETIKDGGTFNYEQEFAERTKGKDYFLVTYFSEFGEQQPLRNILLSGYPIYSQGEYYIIFDLKPDPDD